MASSTEAPVPTPATEDEAEVGTAHHASPVEVNVSVSTGGSSAPVSSEEEDFVLVDVEAERPTHDDTVKDVVKDSISDKVPDATDDFSDGHSEDTAPAVSAHDSVQGLEPVHTSAEELKTPPPSSPPAPSQPAVVAGMPTPAAAAEAATPTQPAAPVTAPSPSLSSLISNPNPAAAILSAMVNPAMLQVLSRPGMLEKVQRAMVDPTVLPELYLDPHIGPLIRQVLGSAGAGIAPAPAPNTTLSPAPSPTPTSAPVQSATQDVPSDPKPSLEPAADASVGSEKTQRASDKKRRQREKEKRRKQRREDEAVAAGSALAAFDAAAKTRNDEEKDIAAAPARTSRVPVLSEEERAARLKQKQEQAEAEKAKRKAAAQAELAAFYASRKKKIETRKDANRGQNRRTLSGLQQQSTASATGNSVPPGSTSESSARGPAEAAPVPDQGAPWLWQTVLSMVPPQRLAQASPSQIARMRMLFEALERQKQKEKQTTP